jgi:hypothetical protein
MKAAIVSAILIAVIFAIVHYVQKQRASWWYQLHKHRTIYTSQPTADERNWQDKCHNDYH